MNMMVQALFCGRAGRGVLLLVLMGGEPTGVWIRVGSV